MTSLHIPDPSGTPPVTASLRTPVDVLALVPTLFGFVPEQSLVMLASRASRQVHARVDLPTDSLHLSDVPDVVASLQDAVVRGGVEQLVLVAYTDDRRLGEATCRAVATAMTRRGIGVEVCLRADGSRWFPVGPEGGPAPTGTPYDLSSHVFVTRAVLEGRVVLRTRADLAQSLRPDPCLVEQVERHRGSTLAGHPAPPQVRCRRVADLVRRRTGDDQAPEPAETALLLDDLRDLDARDEAWALMTRADAARHVRFWTHVLRAAPGDLVAAPATLLAFAAWLSGHGALAWCALDRTAEADPDYRLAGHLARLLQAAVPPDAWEPGVLLAQGPPEDPRAL